MLLRDGQVDVERTRELVELARPMEVTFHRAIDWAPQMEEALEQVIEAGADRILTSGGAQTAMLGVNRIARMVAKADRRIGVMVCGTVRKENIGEIARRTQCVGVPRFFAKAHEQSCYLQKSNAVFERAGRG